MMIHPPAVQPMYMSSPIHQKENNKSLPPAAVEHDTVPESISSGNLEQTSKTSPSMGNSIIRMIRFGQTTSSHPADNEEIRQQHLEGNNLTTPSLRQENARSVNSSPASIGRLESDKPIVRQREMTVRVHPDRSVSVFKAAAHILRPKSQNSLGAISERCQVGIDSSMLFDTKT